MSLRWLYHIVRSDEAEASLGESYAPPSLAREGFLHASYQPEVVQSARVHFAGDAALTVLRIDPRRLDVPVHVAETPRGPMPHIHGPVPADAIIDELDLDAVTAAPDRVTGTRFAFVAFEGMTLLDLVGAYDPIARIASMGFDPASSCEIVSAQGFRAWQGALAELRVTRVRPDLGEFDVVVVAGGPATRALVENPDVTAWLAEFPSNRLIASVCTGALLLGAAGRLQGRRATTHARALELLGVYGAVAVRERIVDEGQLITAAGVTSGIDLCLHLVKRLVGEAAANAIAARMELK